MELPHRSRTRKAAGLGRTATSITARNSSAPWSPTLFRLRSSSVSDLFLEMAEANCRAPLDPTRLSDRSIFFNVLLLSRTAAMGSIPSSEIALPVSTNSVSVRFRIRAPAIQLAPELPILARASRSVVTVPSRFTAPENSSSSWNPEETACVSLRSSSTPCWRKSAKVNTPFGMSFSPQASTPSSACPDKLKCPKIPYFCQWQAKSTRLESKSKTRRR
mmetsp:Transcript_50484/g.94291  ORF Transcript_50484/g.94291 Transcript_50484/m.94291 type:complete len:218 (-) Transcript_50484:145-798(-)